MAVTSYQRYTTKIRCDYGGKRLFPGYIIDKPLLGLVHGKCTYCKRLIDRGRTWTSSCCECCSYSIDVENSRYQNNTYKMDTAVGNKTTSHRNSHTNSYTLACTYVYIRNYTYIHTYVHTVHANQLMETTLYFHSVTYMCMYIRTYICTYIHTYIHKFIRMYVHTYKVTNGNHSLFSLSYIRTYICTYVYSIETHIMYRNLLKSECTEQIHMSCKAVNSPPP